jgi:hypothetical protein
MKEVHISAFDSSQNLTTTRAKQLGLKDSAKTIELKITGTIPPTGNVKPCPGMPIVVMPSLFT